MSLPFRVEPCACGGQIVARANDWYVIREAILEHGRTTQHREWRATGGDDMDPELFGRLPMEPTDVLVTVDVSGLGVASAPSEAVHLCGYDLCMTFIPEGRELCRFHSRSVHAVAA